MNSSIEGRIRRVMARTVFVASSRVAKVATRVAGGRCFGTAEDRGGNEVLTATLVFLFEALGERDADGAVGDVDASGR